MRSLQIEYRRANRFVVALMYAVAGHSTTPVFGHRPRHWDQELFLSRRRIQLTSASTGYRARTEGSIGAGWTSETRRRGNKR